MYTIHVCNMIFNLVNNCVTQQLLYCTVEYGVYTITLRLAFVKKSLLGTLDVIQYAMPMVFKLP
jgi:hypothetical protein